MIRYIAALLLWVALSGEAFAQAEFPPVALANQATKGIATSLVKARRTNLMGVKPQGSSMTSLTKFTYDPANSGKVSAAVITFPDAYTEVQIAFGSQNATDAYTIKGATVAASSGYGSATGAPGVVPLDPYGTAYTTALPVSFNNGGVCKGALNGLQQGYTGDATSGAAYLALVVPATGSVGANTVAFTSITTSSMTGSLKPVAGMYITDGLGTFPAGTQIGTPSGNNLPLANGAVTTLAVQQNELAFFSFQPLTLSFNVPASPSPLAQTWICSDPIPLNSIPRSDGGYPVGASVTGTNVAGIISVISPNSITGPTISGGGIAASEALTITTQATTTADVLPNYQFDYAVDDLSKAWVGAVVTLSSGAGTLPTGSSAPVVKWVSGTSGSGTIRLSAAPTAKLVSGAVLQFTATAWTASGAQAAGASPISMIDTTSDRLLFVRAALTASGSNTIATFNYSATLLKDDQANGLPLITYNQTGTSQDSVNFPVTATNAGSLPAGASPIYATFATSVHSAILGASFGDSTSEGATAGLTSSAFMGRFAAQALKTSTMPVTWMNFGFAGQTCNDYCPEAAKFIADEAPSIAWLQTLTGNGVSNVQSDYTRTNAIANFAVSVGTLPILVSHTVYGALNPGQWTVASATSASTTVPVTEAVTNTISNVLLTAGPGATVPANTVCSFVKSLYSLTCNNAMTLSAGAILYTNFVQTSGVSSSTSIPLSTNFPLNQQLYLMVGTGVPNNTCSGVLCGVTVSCIAASASCTSTGGSVTIAANTTLQFLYVDPLPLVTAEDVSRVTSLSASDSGWLTFNPYKEFSDPANSGNYIPACTNDGVHPNLLCSKNQGLNTGLFANDNDNFYNVMKRAIGQ